MNVATGTKYLLAHEPFVVFDLMEGERRCPYDEMRSRALQHGLVTAHLIHDGGPISIETVMDMLGEFGFHGALETVEGAVWRVERRGEFDFMAKLVRHDKIDGKYLPGLHGNETYIANVCVAP
jgi:hypothetical protein